jgi:hypothetical protein
MASPLSYSGRQEKMKTFGQAIIEARKNAGLDPESHTCLPARARLRADIGPRPDWIRVPGDVGPLPPRERDASIRLKPMGYNVAPDSFDFIAMTVYVYPALDFSVGITADNSLDKHFRQVKADVLGHDGARVCSMSKR